MQINKKIALLALANSLIGDDFLGKLPKEKRIWQQKHKILKIPHVILICKILYKVEGFRVLTVHPRLEWPCSTSLEN